MDRAFAVMGAVSRTLDRLGGIVVLPVMTFMMTLDVILRYFFNSPLIWGLELAEHLLILVFLCAILEATRTDGNIRMDLFYMGMKPRAQQIVSALTGLCGIAVFVLLATKAAEDIPFLYSIPESTEYLHLPFWAYYAFIAVVSVLMVIYFALRVIALVLGVQEPPAPAPIGTLED